MKMKMKKMKMTPQLFSMTYDDQDKNDLDYDDYEKKDDKHRSYCKVSSKTTRCYKSASAPPSS